MLHKGATVHFVWKLLLQKTRMGTSIFVSCTHPIRFSQPAIGAHIGRTLHADVGLFVASLKMACIDEYILVIGKTVR